MSDGHIPGLNVARVPPGADTDPSRRWTRELGLLRKRVDKLRLGVLPGGSAGIEALEESLNLCASLLQEVAGAHLTAQRLKDQARQEIAQWEYLFEQLPVACISTDGNGSILAGNRHAALLLNLSAQRLKDRLLLHFAVDRDAFDALLRTMRYEGAAQQTSLVIRPRERAPVEMHVSIIPHGPADTTRWLWFFTPGDPVVNGRRESRMARTGAPASDSPDSAAIPHPPETPPESDR